jgi:hypothetical protein
MKRPSNTRLRRVSNRLAFASLLVAALVVSACVARTSDPPAQPMASRWDVSSDRPARPVTLPLVPYLGELVTISAMIGDDTLRLLFDTGAGQTLLTPQVLARLGCIPIEAASEFRMTGERVVFTRCPGRTLRFGSFAAVHSSLGGFDLMSLLPAGAPPLDGVLSLASFAGQVVSLDLSCRHLTIESQTSAIQKVRRMRPISARLATGQSGASLILFLQVQTVSLPVWLEFDSGNLSDVFLSPAAASLLGFAAGATAASVELSIEGLEPRPVRVSTRSLVHDGALNHAFIAQGEFTFDLASGRGWAGPRKDARSCQSGPASR